MLPMVSSLLYDSDRVPATSRLNDWRQLMSATHDVSVPESGVAGFHVDMKLWNLGPVIISAGKFSGQTFTRSPDHVRHDHIDHYLLFIQGRGQRLIHTAGREFLLKPGDIALMEMGRPCGSLATDGTSNSLYLTREVLQEAFPAFDYPHGRVLRDGASRLLGAHVRALAAQLAELQPESLCTLPYLVEATKNLAFACLASTQEQTDRLSPPVDVALRHTIERHIETNLGDPELSATTICQTFGISRSTLYRMFDLHAGVAGYIKRRRLQRARAVLASASDNRSLAEIAGDFGFRSGAHFSRSFREAFGCAPSDLRASRSGSRSGHGVIRPINLEAIFR